MVAVPGTSACMDRHEARIEHGKAVPATHAPAASDLTWFDAERACRLGVFLHGAAGDLAESRMGQAGMVAGDLLRHLGPALQQLIAPERPSAT